MRSRTKDEQLTFRLTAEMKQEVRNAADASGRTMGQVCEALLRLGLKELDRKGLDLLNRELRRP
jgi:hypothetical protein